MSGHSKWATIKHSKGRKDAKKAKIFTKIIREITVASRVGGGDIDHNPRLRLAVDKALSNNLPKDTIDRAIKRGVGGLEGANVEEIIYEGYGPSGVAVIVECLTDNRNRIVAEVRHAFTKVGGNLATSGAVSYLFAKKGQIIFAPGSDEEKIIEEAINYGAEDVVVNEDGSIDVITNPENFEIVKNSLSKADLKFIQADVIMMPSTKVNLDKESAEKMLRLVDTLEDLDDVQEVYSNADISDKIFSELNKGGK